MMALTPRWEELARQLSAPVATAVMAAALAIVAAGGIRWVLTPTWSEYQKLRHEGSAEALEAARERANALAAGITALEEEIAGLRANVYGGSLDIAPREMESWVIERADQISARSDVRLDSVTPGEPTQVLMFDEHPYDVEVSGRYMAIYEWLRALEEELRPMIVKGFDMRRHETTGAVHVGVRLVSYRPIGEQP